MNNQTKRASIEDLKDTVEDKIDQHSVTLPAEIAFSMLVLVFIASKIFFV